MAYFVVISEQGAAWNTKLSMREQNQWSEHASFMNSLVDQGFVILGGPIKDPSIHKARLIVKSESESEVRDRLIKDPWIQSGLLKTASIELWEVLLSKED